MNERSAVAARESTSAEIRYVQKLTAKLSNFDSELLRVTTRVTTRVTRQCLKMAKIRKNAGFVKTRLKITSVLIH
jgi:hypothetical protein